MTNSEFIIETELLKWRYDVRVGEQVVASVVFRLDKEDNACSLWDLSVEPDHRHKGIGELLVNTCIGACTLKRRSYLWLHVRRDNAAAICLYTKLGFIVTQLDEQNNRLTMRYSPNN